MKVGIIGSGEVGQALANAFLSEGNEAMIGTRNISKAEIVKWKKENPKGQAGSFSDAAKFGEIIILATKGSKILDAIKLTGLANFSNKVVIDATNPLADAPPDNGVLKFFTTLDESLMERIQKLIP